MATRPSGSDNFADAPLIGVGDFGYYTTTVGKTLEPGEPVGARSALSRTMWWKLRVLEAGVVSITTGASRRFDDVNWADTYMNLWSGTALNNLALVAADDDSAWGSNSLVTASLQPGDYYVQVGLYSGTSADANIVLEVAPGTAWQQPRNRGYHAGGFGHTLTATSPFSLSGANAPSGDPEGGSSYYVYGSAQPKGSVTELARFTVPILPNMEHTFGHSAVGPFPLGGASRVVMRFEVLNSSGGVIWSQDMPRGALSPLTADSPFFASIKYPGSPSAATFRAISKMEMHPTTGYTGSGGGFNAFSSLDVIDNYTYSLGPIEPYPEAFAMPAAVIQGRGDGRGPLGSAPRMDKMHKTRQGLFRPGGIY